MLTNHTMEHRRILITRLKFIGDIVLTTPLIRSVRNRYPDAFIAYLGGKEGVSLLEHNPCLDEIVPYDFARPTFLEQPKVAFALRRRKFDLSIDLFGNPRSALLTYMSGARVRVGPDRSGRGRLYTIRVPEDPSPVTAIGFHNRSLRAAGIEPTAERTEIFLTDDERREAGIFLRWQGSTGESRGGARPLVGLHPGATWPAKRWPPEKFAALAELLAAKSRADVIVTAGPGDRDAAAAFSRACTSSARVLPVLPLRQLAAVIAQCRVYVSNDAGPMHIAAAVGTPTVGLFGPGEENIWFPYRSEEGHVALRKDVPCHPCHLDFCDRTGDGYMECMRLLGVDEVHATVDRLLRRGGR